jgi:hypothetical protein
MVSLEPLQRMQAAHNVGGPDAQVEVEVMGAVAGSGRSVRGLNNGGQGRSQHRGERDGREPLREGHGELRCAAAHTRPPAPNIAVGAARSQTTLVSAWR